VASAVRGLHGLPVPCPAAADGPSTDPTDWHLIAPCHPLLRAWADLTAACKLRDTIRTAGVAVRPQYQVLPRLRSRGPDLDAARRLGLPPLFRPRPGHVFLVLRCADLPLKALAAYLERSHAPSPLADLCRAGRAPRWALAQRVSGLEPEAFAAMAAQNPREPPESLRLADALLRSLPLGVGEEGFREVARHDFGIEIVPERARSLFERVLVQEYPELGRHLADDTLELMAARLGATWDEFKMSLRIYVGEGVGGAQLRNAFLPDSPRTPWPFDINSMLLPYCRGHDPLENLLREGRLAAAAAGVPVSAEALR